MASGKYVRKKQRSPAALITVAAVLLIALALVVGNLCFVFAGGKLIAKGKAEIDLQNAGLESTEALLRLKDPRYIDLRGNGISVESYESLQAAFPSCAIRWDVPLGGAEERWDSDAEQVKVTRYSAELAPLYTLLPNLKEADLREAALTPADFEQLQAMLPGCRILWSVPIGAVRCDSSAANLTLGDLTEEDVSLFSYFEQLKQLELTGSSHESYMALEAMLPECEILRGVQLGDCPVSAADTEADLKLSGVTAEELKEKLAYLPNLELVQLAGDAFETAELQQLRATYPAIRFSHDIAVGGAVCSSLDPVITPDSAVTAEELLAVMQRFEAPETLDLQNCSLTAEELLEVQALCPEALILANVDLYGKVFSTETEEIDISYIRISDTAPIENALPLFPNLKKVIMSDCGISNEDMDALNRRHEDVLFVWTLHFSLYHIRTDITAFNVNNVSGLAPQIGDVGLEPIKYLTELEALDLGHMHFRDMSFLYNMPKLRYLIMVDSAWHDLTPIASLPELYYLEIFKNTVDDLSPLLECKNLRYLNVGYTKYSQLEVLMQMDYLERLWYPGNPFTEEEKAELVAALPNTECYLPSWDADGSTGGGWRTHDSYYEMRDFFGMAYMKEGAGMPGH